MIFQVDTASTRRAVCIISNDRSMAAMLRLMFVAMGVAAPECFAEAGEALPRVGEKSPDLILCDCRNSTAAARKLIGRLSANAETAEIPVVAITAANSESLWLEAIKAGASEFLFSPFNVSDLFGAMETALTSFRRDILEPGRHRSRA